MFGFIILNLSTGKTIVDRDYSDCKFGTMRESQASSSTRGPSVCSMRETSGIAETIYNLIKLQENAFDELGASYIQLFGDNKICIERSNNFPIAIAIFYTNIETELIQDFASKLLYVFIEKFESKALSPHATPSDFGLVDKYFLPLVEDLIADAVKLFVLDLSSLSLYVPWVYICLLARPKVPLVSESTSFLPTDSASAISNKAKIMYASEHGREPSQVNGLGHKPGEECKMRNKVKGESRFSAMRSVD